MKVLQILQMIWKVGSICTLFYLLIEVCMDTYIAPLDFCVNAKSIKCHFAEVIDGFPQSIHRES